MQRSFKIFIFFIMFLISSLQFIPSILAQSLPSFEELQTGINELKPAGDTICARGGEFAFYVRPGNRNKVVVDFIGGGACWSKETCEASRGIFSDTIDDIRDRIRTNDLDGIYDFKNPRHPLQDWTYIVVPYCTGDLHWGDNNVTYGEGENKYTVHHKGAVNVRSVFDWVQKNFHQVNNLTVTGCSAGSYGSIYWAPHLQQMYPQAQLRQFGDSAAGVITKSFLLESFHNWNATKNAPRWIPSLNPENIAWNDFSLNKFYIEIGKYYPQMHLAQYNSALDNVQSFFYEIMGGGNVDEWSQHMFSFMNSMTQELPNYNYFIAPGEEHCILPYNNLYTQKSHDVSLIQWLDDYLKGKEVQNVKCTDCDPITQLQ